MSKHLILCIEADKQSKTDMLYIDKLIKETYKIDNSIKIDYIYLCGKRNYNNKKTINDIKKTIKMSQFNQKVVIYCIDLDDYDCSSETKKLNKDIKDFCVIKKFKYVWFCRDVEDVFWGKQVSDTDKVQMAIKFSKKSKAFSSQLLSNMSSNVISKTKSNLVTVLDDVLKKQ